MGRESKDIVVNESEEPEAFTSEPPTAPVT